MVESAAACSSSITIASTTTTSDSETEGSSVSLLDKLKVPKPSDLSRKRKIAINPPPTGKRRSTVVLSLFAKSERDALVVSRHMTTPTERGNKMAATSIEPSRVRAYHDDLKWRMVYQQEALRLPYTIIAKNLGVDTATVWRTVQRFEKTGSVSKK